MRTLPGGPFQENIRTPRCRKCGRPSVLAICRRCHDCDDDGKNQKCTVCGSLGLPPRGQVNDEEAGNA